MSPSSPTTTTTTALLRGGLVATSLSLLMVACSIGETTHATVMMPLRVKKETRTCDSPFAKPDIAGLKACGEGKGHCYDGGKVPIPASLLPACEGKEVCVPDALLKAGGAKPKSCKFFIDNKPGACVSLLIADVKAHENELKQDVCEADERCGPCINPLDGKDTHLCEESGVHEKDCVGGSSESDAEVCCHGMGICSKADGIPEGNRGDMNRDVCPEDKLCAPASMVDGNPVKCSVLGFSGVCVDHCFAAMLKGAGQSMRGECSPTEQCLPCAIGKSQGMPGCD